MVEPSRQGLPASTTSEENILQASLWWHLPNRDSLFSGNSTSCQVDNTVARMDNKAKHGGYAFLPIPRAAMFPEVDRDQHSLLEHHSSPNSRTECFHRVYNCPVDAPLPQASLLDFFVHFSFIFLCKNRCLHRYFSTTKLLCKHTRHSRCNARH